MSNPPLKPKLVQLLIDQPSEAVNPVDVTLGTSVSEANMARFDDFDSVPLDGKSGVTLSANQEATLARLKAKSAQRQACCQAVASS